MGANFDLEQSIAAFADADIVVAPHGAALAFIAFMHEGAAVVEIGYNGKKVWKHQTMSYS